MEISPSGGRAAAMAIRADVGGQEGGSTHTHTREWAWGGCTGLLTNGRVNSPLHLMCVEDPERVHACRNRCSVVLLPIREIG